MHFPSFFLATPSSPVATFGPSSLAQSTESPLSEVILSKSQLDRLQGLFGRAVHIKHKDSKKTYLSVSAIKVVSSFMQSCANCLFFITGDPLIENDRFRRAQRLCMAPCALTLRGSVNTSLILGEELKADLDVVLKSQRSHPSFSSQDCFRFFCNILGLRALEIMSCSDRSYIARDASGVMFIHPEADGLIGIAQGVYKGFIPLFEQRKCIYSFAGLVDENGLCSGVDVDIAVQFPMEHSISHARSLSPFSGTVSTSGSEESVPSLESAFQSIDARSFGHDAIELVIPTQAGTIDFTVRPYFSTLFGFTFPDVKQFIQNRDLVVLDTRMYQGYKRLFYEMTRGKFPKEILTDLQPMSEKIVHIVLKMADSAYNLDMQGKHSLFDFIKQKGQTQEFRLTMYYNTYKTAKILSEQLELESELSKAAEDRMHGLNEIVKKMEASFHHQGWQSIFPEVCSSHRSDCPTLEMIDDYFTLRSHLSFLKDTRVSDCFGISLRMTSVDDLSHGFVLTNNVGIKELVCAKERIKAISDTPLVQKCLNPLFGRFAELSFVAEEQLIFCYFIARLNQETLSTAEFDEIACHLPQFLDIWMRNHAVIGKRLNSVTVNFIVKSKDLLIPLSDRELFFKILSSKSRESNKDSLFLPSYLHFMLRIKEGSSLENKERMTRLLLSFLQVDKGIYGFQILTYFSTMAECLYEDGLHAIIDFILQSPLSQNDLSDSQRAGIKQIVEAAIDCDMAEHILPIVVSPDMVNDIPLEKVLLRAPRLFFQLEDQLSQLVRLLEAGQIDLIQDLFLMQPEQMMELFASYIQEKGGVDLQLTLDISSTEEMKKMFLLHSQWAHSLAKVDPVKVGQVFEQLKGLPQKQHIPKFLRSLVGVDARLSALCFLQTKQQMQKFIIDLDPKFWLDCIYRNRGDLKAEDLFHLVPVFLSDSCLQGRQEQSGLYLMECILDHLAAAEMQGSMLALYLETFLPSLKELKERDKRICALYPQLVKAGMSPHVKKHLSAAVDHLLTNEVFDLGNQEMDVLVFLHIAKEKTIDPLTATRIVEKVQASTLTPEIYEMAYALLQEHQEHKKQLLQYGYACKLDVSFLAHSIYECICFPSTLQQMLENILSIVDKKLPLEFIVAQIEQIDPKEALSTTYRPLVEKVLKTLKIVDPQCCRVFIHRFLHLSALGEDKKNYSMFMQVLIEDPKLLESVFYQEVISVLKQANLLLESHDYLSLLRQSLSKGGSLVVLKHMGYLPVDVDFVTVMENVVDRIAASSCPLKNDITVFRIIFEQIQRIEKAQEGSNKELFLGLYEKFADLYLLKLIQHAPEIAMGYLEGADLERTEGALSKITAQHRDVPLPFLGDLLDLLERKQGCFSSEKIKKEVLSCFSFYFATAPSQQLKRRLSQCEEMLGDSCFEGLLLVALKRILQLKDYPFAAELLDKKDLFFCGDDIEVKKRQVRADLSSLYKEATPASACDLFRIFWQLRKELGPKVRSYLVHCANVHLQSPFDEDHFAQVRAIYKNISLLSDFYEEMKGLSKSYCRYFEGISEGDYIENFPFFYRRKNTDPLCDAVEKLFTKNALPLWSKLCFASPLSAENILSIEAFKDLFLTANVINHSLIEALIGMCREQLPYLAHKVDLDSVEKDHLAAISCMYCHLTDFAENELSQHSSILPSVIQKILQGNFTQNISAFMAEGYILLCRKSFDPNLFELIISVLYSCSRSSFSEKEKIKVKKIFYDHVIPLYLKYPELSSSSSAFFDILVEFGSDSQLSSNHIDSLLKLVVIKMATTLPTDTLELTFCLNCIQTQSLLELISNNRENSYSLDCLCKIISFLVCVSSCSYFANDTILSLTSSVLENVVAKINRYEAIDAKAKELTLQIKLNPSRIDLRRSPMVIPLRTMYVLVPAILDNMRKIMLQEGVRDSVTQKIVSLCAQFYLKMDDLIGSKGGNFLEYSMHPYLAIDVLISEPMIHMLEFFVDKLKQETRIQSILQLSRILVGFALHHQLVEKSHRTNDPEDKQHDDSALAIEHFSMMNDEIIQAACLRSIRTKAGVNAKEMQDISTLLHGSYTTNADLATANLINMGLALIEFIDKRTNQEIGNLSILMHGIYDFHMEMGMQENIQLIFSEIKVALPSKYERALLQRLSPKVRDFFKEI